MPKPIYVEAMIRGSMDRVWELTQSPDLHRRWDLRFTDIDYLPRPDPALPQRFLYATRIGLGLDIRGHGETVGGGVGADGSRSSALKFWSADPKSLIHTGAGYWKYVPVDGGLRFLTGYGYDVRFGAAGRAFDRWVFRPLMGWATAWSFDRLRIWVEQGIPPDVSLRRAVTHVLARGTVAFVWLYQGLVPKLVVRHADELSMIRAAGLSAAGARWTCLAAGIAEVTLGLVLLLTWRARWPLWVTVVAMPVALAAVATTAPRFLVAAFNPVSLNLATAALAVIALLGGGDVPSASRCLRRPPTGTEGA
jgi:uncharacterized membrane protein YphA (DoxX/SURF4 family)